MFTKESIYQALKDNHFKDTEFTLCDGTKATVSPCFYGETVSRIEEIEYYLVYCDLPWLGGDSLDKISSQFNNIIKLRNEADEEKIRLRNYFAENEERGWDDDSWGFYSDWHKDVYGYRPHGRVCGVYVDPWAIN